MKQSEMKKTNIKGKDYVEVNERLKFFRSEFKGWCLTSEIISLENQKCIIKATITDDKGIERATGIAYEKEGSSFINKTSYIENCETSAWGRALGNLGIGIDTSVSSSEEVKNAIKQQNDTPNATKKQIKLIKNLTKDLNEEDVKKSLKKYKVNKIEDLNIAQASSIIKKLK